MIDVVKPTRRYRSARRTENARQTREAILEAAAERFLADGWSKTTVASIARNAAVSNETVYSIFGTKRALLHELVVRAVRGGDPETPLVEQAEPLAIAALTDQRRQIALFAADITRVLSRVGPLMAVTRAAAEAEPELAELYRGFHAGRRQNLAFFARALLNNAPLRDGLDEVAATSILWRLASPELFMLMRDVEGVSPGEYEEWLAAVLSSRLIAG